MIALGACGNDSAGWKEDVTDLLRGRHLSEWGGCWLLIADATRHSS